MVPADLLTRMLEESRALVDSDSPYERAPIASQLLQEAAEEIKRLRRVVAMTPDDGYVPLSQILGQRKK